ncbi:ABC transporter ATP-binding protein/permease [Methylosinus sp. KRF6]|uniref:ABC transporter ATP-binding protein/permease n=1 Tax=Methylosinus sp. KRF6 TaxID=2846853 RepID=UPI001C0BADFE|nr:ABC transporter ATP-binding protein/permease [Methylosinus sp. KRF6]MBU3890834.1 ABC transporter ATP-binding protein/permease [Methylosinus sp. KRF6]
MAKDASTRPGPVAEPGWISREFAREALTLGQVLWGSPARGVLIGIWAALIVVIGATAYGQIALNAWNQPFYDALARRDAEGFAHQLGVFAVIAGALLVLNVAQTWLNQMSRVELRRRLTRDLFSQWLAPKRAFLLAGTGDIGVNPDQRVHEDARHLSELTTDLGVGLLQAALLLVCFIGVLWGLSKGVTLHFWDKSVVIPGYMVWSALFYAGAASLASWLVGRPLVGLNSEHYARESDMRFALVHVNEHSEGVAVYRGEAEEEQKLDLTFDRLLVVLRDLVRATTNLSWVTAGYGWFTIVAPIVVAAPAFFSGDLTLGGLLMSAGAFTQVQQSLRWFVDNAGAIADWRATLHRVGAFRLALLELDKIGEATSRIEFREAASERLVLDELQVSLPTGSIRLSESHVEASRGARILIVGAARSGKTCLFRAIAGLWPWGSGSIELPLPARVMFMPKRPFISDGDLRHILAYPGPPDAFQDEQLLAALTRLDLGYLGPDLHRSARWDQELTHEEQLGLAFARLLLHKPDWVVVDEAIEAISPERRDLVFEALANELSSTSLLAIGSPRAEASHYNRILRLVFDPKGPRLAPIGKKSEVA